MSILSDFKKEQAKATKPVKNSILQQYKQERGLVEKEPSLARKAVNVAGAVGRGFIEMFSNPSEAQRSYEQQVLPKYSDNSKNPVLKAIQAPGTFITRNTIKGLTRFINPGLQPLATDIAEIKAVGEKGGIADKIEQGLYPAEVLEDFKTLEKNGMNIAGDVAQAVLTAYGGSVGTGLIREGSKKGVTQALKSGAITGTQLGALFGTAEVASEPSESLVENFKTVGISSAVGGILGGIFEGTIPATKEVRQKVSQYVRKKGFDKLSDESKAQFVRVSGDKDSLPKRLGIKSDNLENDVKLNRILSEDEIETIDFGPGSQDELATIQVGDPDLPKIPGYKYEPIKNIIESGKNAPSLKKQIEIEANEIAQKTVDDTIVKPKMVDEIAESIRKENDIPDFEHQKNKEQIAQILKKDIQEIKDVALGRKEPTDNIPKTAYFATLKNIADDQALKGDSTLAIELSRSNVGREAGQELQALNISSKDNIVDILTDIRTKIEDRLPNRVKKVKEKEINKLYNDMQQAFDSIKSEKPDRVSIEKALADITCK